MMGLIEDLNEWAASSTGEHEPAPNEILTGADYPYPPKEDEK
jgi:hypothetical protein